MLVDETRTFRHRELGEGSWSVAAKSVELVLPDASTDDAKLVTAASDPTNSLAYIFSFQDTINVGGKLKVTWVITPSNGDVLRRPVYYWVYWTDVSSVIRQRMQIDANVLTDSEIDLEFAMVYRYLVSLFPAMPVYSALPDAERDCFDIGAALLTALRLRLYKPSLNPGGPVKVWKIQQNTLEFAVPTGTSPISLEDQWYDEAWTSLRCVASIASGLDAMSAGFHMFQVDGPTRNRLTTRRDSLWSVTMSLLTDQTRQWDLL